jgi:hypothetical protein
MKPVHKRQPHPGLTKILHKEYDRKDSVAKKKKVSVRKSQGAWRQDELMAVSRQS